MHSTNTKYGTRKLKKLVGSRLKNTRAEVTSDSDTESGVTTRLRQRAGVTTETESGDNY